MVLQSEGGMKKDWKIERECTLLFLGTGVYIFFMSNKVTKGLTFTIYQGFIVRTRYIGRL